MKNKKFEKVPYHLGVWLNGNRRWAKEQGLSTYQGHLKGYQNAQKICRWSKDRGVKILTLYGFSTENWNRPKKEVNYLMKLLERGLSESLAEFQKEKIKVKIIGQKERLPKFLQKVIGKVEKLTKDNKEFILNLAVSYGGRWDILQAIQKIMKKNPPVKNITEDLIESYLSTAGLPAPDLIIRPGGEKRLSNFLLWQTAYSEFYFSEKLWPDFSEKDLDKFLKEYSQRQRRFGR